MATQAETQQPKAQQVHNGECFCGQVKVEVRGAPVAQGYCHCQSCRSMSGAPLRGFTLWPADAVRITSGEEVLKGYNKTDFSDRRHCANCGGQVLIYHPTIGMTDVHSEVIADFDFQPGLHVNYQERHLPIRDGLPKFKDFPAAFGGSDETIPE